MSIDTEDRPTNVKTVTLPEASKGTNLPFNPERDISDKQWSEWREIAKNAASGHLSVYGRYVAGALFVFPQRSDELSVPPFEILREAGYLTPYEVKLIYPYHPTAEIVAGKYRSSFGEMYSDMMHCFYRKNPDDLTVLPDFILQAFVLYPDRINELAEINGLLNSLNSEADSAKLNGNWDNFANQKAAVLLLGKDPKITQREWNGMRGYLQKKYVGLEFVKTAVSMKLLTAQEVRMTDQGIELIMSGVENVSRGQPVPQTKKY